MCVFVTDAPRLHRFAVTRKLLASDHQVLGLACSDVAAKTHTEAGAEGHRA